MQIAILLAIYTNCFIRHNVKAKLSGCQIAAVYNGIKLAHLPDHLKEYITSDQIPATTALSLVRSTEKSPTFHRDVEAKIKAELGENYRLYQYMKYWQNAKGVQARMPFDIYLN